MTQTFQIKFAKKSTIIEVDGANWMVDTGCPIRAGVGRGHGWNHR